jgi:hypothetical protein
MRRKSGEVVIDETRARNDRIELKRRFLVRQSAVSRGGIYAPESGARVKMSLSAMQEATGAPGKCTYILVSVATPKNRSKWRVALTPRFPQQNPVNARCHDEPRKNIPFLGVFLRTLVGLSAIVSTLVIMLAMYTTITERTREIGILKAMARRAATSSA